MPQKILVTGGAGFIGSHFIEHLLKNTDWHIVVIDRLTYASSGFDRLRDINVFDGSRVKIFTADFTKPIEEGLAKEIGDVDYIVHMGAETHVDRSIDNAEPFVLTNVLGTLRMLEFARTQKMLKRFLYFSTDEVFGPAPEGTAFKEWDRYNSKNPYAASKAGGEELAIAYQNTHRVPVMITHCHDDATRALTPHGIKSVTELAVGDKVFALKGKELVETPIREIVHSSYKGNMIRIGSNKVSQMVTPHHRMLISKAIGKPRRWQPYEIVRADSLLQLKGRVRIPVNGEWHCAAPVDVAIPQALLHNANTVHAVALDIFLEFLGWFIAEGCALERGTVSIANNNGKVQRRLIELFALFGLHASVFGRSVQSSSVALAAYLREHCGVGAEHKKIPEFVLQYPSSYLNILLRSLMAGDGTWYGRSGVYYTKSKKLAEQVAELGIKLGYSAALSSRKTWNPSKTKLSTSFIVRLRADLSSIEQRHISQVPYDGGIWCLRTDEGNFFIERDGIISCSGNTMNVFGERQHPEKFIPMTVRKILAGERVTIHSNKEKTKAGSRFWIHGRNVAAAIMFLLDKGDIGDKYNIVGEREVDNLEMAHIIARVLGKPLHYEMVDFHSSRPGHDLRYALDGAKLQAMGWRLPMSFDQSLEKTIRWTVEHPKWLTL